MSASRFVADLERRFDATDALLVDSGTTALSLAVAGAGASGLPVAIPAYSCYDIVTAVVGAGSRVVVYDGDPSTLGPDEASLDRLRSQPLAPERDQPGAHQPGG